jgi:hypothetical protein
VKSPVLGPLPGQAGQPQGLCAKCSDGMERLADPVAKTLTARKARLAQPKARRIIALEIARRFAVTWPRTCCAAVSAWAALTPTTASRLDIVTTMAVVVLSRAGAWAVTAPDLTRMGPNAASARLGGQRRTGVPRRTLRVRTQGPVAQARLQRRVAQQVPDGVAGVFKSRGHWIVGRQGALRGTHQHAGGRAFPDCAERAVRRKQNGGKPGHGPSGQGCPKPSSMPPVSLGCRGDAIPARRPCASRDCADFVRCARADREGSDGLNRAGSVEVANT